MHNVDKWPDFDRPYIHTRRSNQLNKVLLQYVSGNIGASLLIATFSEATYGLLLSCWISVSHWISDVSVGGGRTVWKILPPKKNRDNKLYCSDIHLLLHTSDYEYFSDSPSFIWSLMLPLNFQSKLYAIRFLSKVLKIFVNINAKFLHYKPTK